MAIDIGRRDFISALGAVTFAWPLAARAQRPDRMRRIGVFMNLAADDPQSSKEISAFLDGLKDRGWTPDGNLQIEYRWGAGDANLNRKYAPELVAFAPDVFLVAGGTTVGILQNLTRTVPIVFVEVSDAVNRGLVASLAQPGGDATGFTQLNSALLGNGWNCSNRSRKRDQPPLFAVQVKLGIGQFAVIQATAPRLGVEIQPDRRTRHHRD